MILTPKELRYFSELPSTVAHALPQAPNPEVPFFLDDPVTQRYELLRSVWRDRKSAKAACHAQGFSRAEYYRLENAFLKHGVAAVYPPVGASRQNPKLERLALLVKSTRPLATEMAIVRLAEALRIEPRASLRTVGHILHCHGLGANRDEEDREYWRGIQQILRALEFQKSQPGPPRTKADRAGTFYLSEDPLHVRWELFRELGSEPGANIAETVRRYGLSRPTFYKYLERFRRYGPWGLVDWVQLGRTKDKASEELELRIIEEKLEHPRLSLDELLSRLELKCSRASVYEILRFWGLLEKDRPAVSLRGFWDQEEPERPAQLWRTAKEAFEAGEIDIPRKVNAHFERLLDSLRTRPLAICEPGPIILAQFVDDLGITEALWVHGPKRPGGGEITNLVLLNVFRIIAGYETVGYLREVSDRSVAIAAGVGVYPGKTALYEGFSDLKFEHLQALRNDAAARARDLGLIRGERIAQDFHFKEFYGHAPEEEEIGLGPTSAGEICPGFRPHVIWDLDTDVLVNIAFANGAVRAARIVREFCEKNLYSILDRGAIREIYMDSEYTSFPLVNYLVVDEFSTTDVIMCLRRNKKIELLVKEVTEEGRWEEYSEDYEIAGKRFQLPGLRKPLHLVVKRNKKTKDWRCFGTTCPGLENREVLLRYRLRWPIENGLKDLIRSYFIDQLLGKDPERIETNFYCIQVARLAYELFLKSLDERYVRDSAGCKKTLATFRRLLFARQNCQVRLRGDDLELTFLDAGPSELHSALRQLLERRRERGLNRVAWWGRRGLRVECADQWAAPPAPECSKNASEDVS